MFNTLKIGIRIQRIDYSLSLQTFLIASIRGFGRGLDSISNIFGLLLSRILYYQVPRILTFIRKFPGSNVIMKTCIFFRVQLYRGADKSLARPASCCILFDGENISFHASLVIYIYIHIHI